MAGVLYAWGRNNKGQIGDNTTTANNKSSPVSIVKDGPWLGAGDGAEVGMAVDSNGMIWC
jgi:alpha-tubulin suppressor-like RCC1 family protein